MAHLVIGILLVTIIIVASWLIAFYSRVTNKKSLVVNSWRLLNSQIQGRNELLREYLAESTNPINTKLDGFTRAVYTSNDLPGCGFLTDTIRQSQEISVYVSMLTRPYKNCNGKEGETSSPQIISNLAILETRISRCLQSYNELVHDHNLFISSIPNNIASVFLGLQQLPIVGQLEQE